MSGDSGDLGEGRDGASTGADPTAATPLTAVQRVHAHVREGVLSGELEEGTMLSENQIATTLGVSRTPVREAFVQLQSQGYLRLYPRRGALVVPVSRTEINAVLETRWAVERLAVEHLTEVQDRDALAAMHDAIKAQEALLAANDLGAFSGTDRLFHRALIAATRNAILLELYDSLRDRQRRMMHGALGGDPEVAAEIIQEHRAILDAIEAGDAAQATAHLHAHLDGARQTLLD